MANIKDIARIKEKYTRVTPQRSEDYRLGIENPKADWAQTTAQAESRYTEGVQKAITRGAFGKGVKKAGSQKWQKQALAVGPQRFAQGVAAGGDAYAEGFAPYHAAIQAVKLPPKFPKGDPRNIQRVAAMNKALRDKKEQLA